jgi:hypothetical protein
MTAQRKTQIPVEKLLERILEAVESVDEHVDEVLERLNDCIDEVDYRSWRQDDYLGEHR